MIQERFGPIGNDRYQQYLKDIRTSGDHLLSLLNDLLDLSKIEAGKLELNFTEVDLNDLIQQSVALLQPQANRERIIIRTSLGSTVPSVTADARSVRQILLNLLSNSIKFTGAGGQVIVSTALGDESNVVLRVRDTGIGMSEQDLAVALEPFRQLATSARFGSGGTGLGLPLTKALAEANRASFKIKSAVNAGTLVEVAFPTPRIAAE
jgi:signal transduction histidine kinase